MKKVILFFLIVLYSCSFSVKKQEPVKPMSPLECLKENGRWLEISDEYLQKQLYYVGRNDMTEEDHAKIKEYKALYDMAFDSAKFYMDKFNMLVRTDKLKGNYNDLVSVDSLN